MNSGGGGHIQSESGQSIRRRHSCSANKWISLHRSRDQSPHPWNTSLHYSLIVNTGSPSWISIGSWPATFTFPFPYHIIHAEENHRLLWSSSQLCQLHYCQNIQKYYFWMLLCTEKQVHASKHIKPFDALCGYAPGEPFLSSRGWNRYVLI